MTPVSRAALRRRVSSLLRRNGAAEPVHDDHPRVLDLVAGDVVTEHVGALVDLEAPSRAAVVAHWSRSPELTLSVRAFVRALTGAGYQVVLVSSSPADGPLLWQPEDDVDRVVVLRKPNLGYDFGSWAVGLATYPALTRADALVLTNDSLVGPFAPIDDLLAQLDAATTDVWGFTETAQFTRHVQSYFLGFRRGVLRRPALARFWEDVRHYDDKQLVIHRGELAFASLLHAEGIELSAAFAAGEVVDLADNPTIIGWRTLLERGFPFVKRELARAPHLAPDGAEVDRVVRERFGTDIHTWYEQ